MPILFPNPKSFFLNVAGAAGHTPWYLRTHVRWHGSTNLPCHWVVWPKVYNIYKMEFI